MVQETLQLVLGVFSPFGSRLPSNLSSQIHDHHTNHFLSTLVSVSIDFTFQGLPLLIAA